MHDCPPKFGTRRNPDRPTIGPDVEAWSLILSGHRFMPWQRDVANVAGELDPSTVVELPGGRLDGLRWYDLIVLEVPRQSGKTTLDEAEHVTETRRGPERTSVYAAQTLLMARKRLLDEFHLKRLARSPILSPLCKARKSNGSEEIRWIDSEARNSVITIVPNTDDAGHGLTIDRATVDEAFSHVDLTIITGLDPAMITRPDPQLWIVSTIGDGTDGLLQHYEEVGETSLLDPATRVAYFKWCAADDADRRDPATWRSCMPALGYTQTEQRVKDRLDRLPADKFDRSYLCRRPQVKSDAKLNADSWAACAVEAVEFDGPTVLGVAVALDRSAASIVVAGRTVDGKVGVACETQPGTGWAGARLAELVKSRRSVTVCVADRRAGAGTIIDDARARGVVIDELGAGDVVTYCGTFEDLIMTGMLAHQSQPELDTAAARAVDRPMGDAWAWSATKSDANIAPIVGATWAAGRFVADYPAGIVRMRIG